ncbi:exosome complex exonuclease RRP40 [Scheffersomyces coipomensis]|uniref:exosome complex exonuclease RRP40 n=1 Tax=Scheffersomyces coipomensis TaxID=1788519 RepID=UPI00315D95F1
MSEIILPGDKLPIHRALVQEDPENEAGSNITIGPGLYKSINSKQIIPTQAGIFESKTIKRHEQLYYIESNSSRYIPQTNDYVIGVITGVIGGESYKVSLQDFSNPVILSMMAFPNATKKNRPNLQNGQIVYARVSNAGNEIETELECIDPTTGKDGGFGLLDESGFLFNVKSLNYTRELLFNPNSTILEKLSSRCKFEIAIGINGKIWIKCGDGLNLNKMEVEDDNGSSTVSNDSSKDIKVTLAAVKYITQCQHSSPDQFDNILQQSFKDI